MNGPIGPGTFTVSQSVSQPNGKRLKFGSFDLVTVILAELVHPLGAVNVTVYTPDVKMVILCVVAPVFQMILVAYELVSVTESPLQNVVGPLGVIVGGGGIGTTWMMMVGEVLEHPVLVSVTVTENG